MNSCPKTPFTELVIKLIKDKKFRTLYYSDPKIAAAINMAAALTVEQADALKSRDRNRIQTEMVLEMASAAVNMPLTHIMHSFGPAPR